jgi:hypothetical protein
MLKLLILIAVWGPYVVWFLVVNDDLTLSRTEFGVAAIAALAGVMVAGASMAVDLKTAARLREHGVATDATIERVNQVPATPDGPYWTITHVKVSFTDTRGAPVHAWYTEQPGFHGRREGQSIQVVYDPQKPTSISLAGESGKPEDVRSFNAFLMGVSGIGTLATSIYFSFRALG